MSVYNFGVYLVLIDTNKHQKPLKVTRGKINKMA